MTMAHQPTVIGTKSLPPIAALFKGGIVPSSIAIQSLITEIDEQLDVNTKELDSCLQSLLTAANRLPGSRTFSTPKDALGYMCSSHTLEKDTCYDPEQDEAVAIIKALSDSLDRNPGSEESVLQEMLSLASEEGVLLPLRCSPLTNVNVSSSSLNVQVDTMDKLVENKWVKLAHNIQKHLTSELLKLPVQGQNPNFSWAIMERRLELVGGLRSLASDDEAWTTYRNIRGQQLEQIFNSLLPENDSENVNYKEFCGNCDAVADKIIEMMEEDFVILSTGIFKKIGGVHRILHDLYLEKYSDEMSLLVEEIADDIRDFNKKVVKTSKSDHGIHKNQGKLGQRGSLGGTGSGSNQTANEMSWASKAPGNSHSLDTMFLASSYKMDKGGTPRLQKQSSMAFPKDCITSLRHIALSLMKLEDFLECLIKMTSWDVTGLPNKKSKKKSNLRGVLKPCASPELKRHSLNLGSSFSSSDTQLESNAGFSNQGDFTPAPKVIERSRSEDRVRWEWRLIFKKIASGLSTAIETKLEDSLSNALTHESTMWEEKHMFEMIELDFTQYGENMDHPCVVSKNTEEFIRTVHELLPLARAGMDGCLTPVRMAFIDSIGLAVKNFHLHCVSLSKDIPLKANLKQLLVIISNATYIKNYLHHVENVLSAEENGKRFMSNLLKQYTDLVDGLGKHFLQLQNQVISTSVLNDADSGNWSDIKDFYEDERCSFCIQMWNFHMRGIKKDMWAILPPRLAQSLFSSVLQDSLLFIMQRYARVKPSYRRVKQLRYDILATLICTGDHLLSASSSLSHYLDPGHNQTPHYSIHNQCSNLFAIMAVVSSPLDVLYRIFKRGYNRRPEPQGATEARPQGSNTQWLHWIWPSLIHSGTKHYDDMQTASALYLHMRLILNQPIMDWGLLMQALLMKDYALSILLLTRTCLSEGSKASKLATTLSNAKALSPNTNEARGHTNTPTSPSKLEKIHQSFGSTESSGSQGTNPSPKRFSPLAGTPAEPVSSIQQVADAVIHMTAQLQYFPDALAKCIVPTIERTACWEMFNVRNPMISPEIEVPEWMVSIFSLLNPLVSRVIESLIRYLHKVKTADSNIKPVISFVADLPCGCPPNFSLRDHPEKDPTMKEILHHSLELMIGEIEKCVVIIPASVCSLFNALEANCREQNIKTSHRCVALHIIAWALWKQLIGLSTHAEDLGSIVKSEYRNHLPTLADSLFYILLHPKGPNVPRFASKFIKNRKEWLQKKVDNISSFISNEYHSMPEADITEAATNMFCDHLYSLMASCVMDSPQGHKHLTTLSHLVQNNGHWFLEQMDIPSPLSGQEDKPKTKSFTLDITTPLGCPGEFNPMKEMNAIGDTSFNQAAIIDFPINWGAVLSSDLGLSRASFRTLLMNRHEMQDDSELEESEKKPVDVLKAVYERC